MDDRDPFKLSNYRGDNAAQIPCAKCGQLIAAAATFCPHCGIHFQGRAADFGNQPTSARRSPMAIIAIAIFIALIGLALLAVVFTRFG